MSYVSQQFLLFDNSAASRTSRIGRRQFRRLSTSGWTQTADTGQVNWGTIVSVPTSGKFVYEIWQPADALQTGSTKYFVKIHYGTSSGSPAAPRLEVQSGNGDQWSGRLNGFSTANLGSDGGNQYGTRFRRDIRLLLFWGY